MVLCTNAYGIFCLPYVYRRLGFALCSTAIGERGCEDVDMVNEHINGHLRKPLASDKAKKLRLSVTV